MMVIHLLKTFVQSSREACEMNASQLKQVGQHLLSHSVDMYFLRLLFVVDVHLRNGKLTLSTKGCSNSVLVALLCMVRVSCEPPKVPQALVDATLLAVTPALSLEEAAFLCDVLAHLSSETGAPSAEALAHASHCIAEAYSSTGLNESLAVALWCPLLEFYAANEVHLRCRSPQIVLLVRKLVDTVGTNSKVLHDILFVHQTGVFSAISAQKATGIHCASGFIWEMKDWSSKRLIVKEHFFRFVEPLLLRMDIEQLSGDELLRLYSATRCAEPTALSGQFTLAIEHLLSSSLEFRVSFDCLVDCAQEALHHWKRLTFPTVPLGKSATECVRAAILSGANSAARPSDWLRVLVIFGMPLDWTRDILRRYGIFSLDKSAKLSDFLFVVRRAHVVLREDFALTLLGVDPSDFSELSVDDAIVFCDTIGLRQHPHHLTSYDFTIVNYFNVHCVSLSRTQSAVQCSAYAFFGTAVRRGAEAIENLSTLPCSIETDEQILRCFVAVARFVCPIRAVSVRPAPREVCDTPHWKSFILCIAPKVLGVLVALSAGTSSCVIETQFLAAMAAVYMDWLSSCALVPSYDDRSRDVVKSSISVFLSQLLCCSLDHSVASQPWSSRTPDAEWKYLCGAFVY
jgi:hypothetical protein